MKPRTSRMLAVVMSLAMLAVALAAAPSNPVDRIQRAGGRVLIGSTGNVTATVASATGAINLDSKGGVTTIGDVNASGNATKLTINDGTTVISADGLIQANQGINSAGTVTSSSFNSTSASGYANYGLTQTYVTVSDFTTAANTNLQPIPTLTWTITANTAQVIPFHCHLAYSQATAAVNVSFGIQDVSIAPTNIFATGYMQTNTTAFTAGNLIGLASTTATNIVTATPSAITTIWNADLYGVIEHPSNATPSAIQIQVRTATAADAVTVKRGSFCRIN